MELINFAQTTMKHQYYIYIIPKHVFYSTLRPRCVRALYANQPRDERAILLIATVGPCEKTLPRVLFRINDDEVVETAPSISL